MKSSTINIHGWESLTKGNKNLHREKYWKTSTANFFFWSASTANLEPNFCSMVNSIIYIHLCLRLKSIWSSYIFGFWVPSWLWRLQDRFMFTLYTQFHFTYTTTGARSLTYFWGTILVFCSCELNICQRFWWRKLLVYLAVVACPISNAWHFRLFVSQ